MVTTRIVAGWPSLLDRVDWPAFQAALAERADEASRAELESYTVHGRFAVHVLCHVATRDLSTLLRVHETGAVALQLTSADRLADWLQATAHIALGMLQYLASLTAAGASATALWSEPAIPQAPGLYVDPALPELPLLELAHELAEQIGERHHVIAASLPPGAAGRHTRRLRIELDLERAGDRLEQIWLHEFGHALDFLGERPPEQAEDYADELAGLLEEVQPGSLDEAASLCIQAHETVTARERARPRHDLPASGRPSIMAFLELPLTP